MVSLRFIERGIFALSVPSGTSIGNNRMNIALLWGASPEIEIRLLMEPRQIDRGLRSSTLGIDSSSFWEIPPLTWIHFQNIDTAWNGHPQAHRKLDLPYVLNVIPIVSHLIRVI